MVVEFGGDDAAGHLQGESGVEGALILAETGEAVVVLGREEIAQELPLPGKDLDGNSASEDLRHSRGREVNVLAGDDAIKVAQRDLAEQMVAVSFGIMAVDFEAFAGEMNTAVGLVEAGGGHGVRITIYAL